MDKKIWDNIEKALDFDDQLKLRIPDLPVFEPENTLWVKIEDNLPKRKMDITPVQYLIRIASVAASIAIIIFATNGLYRMEQKNFVVQTEIISIKTNDINIEDKAVNEINLICKSNMPICDQPEFRELIEQYDELNKEELELKQAINKIGDSPEMIKAMIKIENLKSETLVDIFTLIQS